MQRNPRRPLASGVLPHGGIGLGLPTTTTLPTRQWTRPRQHAYQQLPLANRGEPQLTFGSAGSPAPDAGDCEDCD